MSSGGGVTVHPVRLRVLFNVRRLIYADPSSGEPRAFHRSAPPPALKFSSPSFPNFLLAHRVSVRGAKEHHYHERGAPVPARVAALACALVTRYMRAGPAPLPPSAASRMSKSAAQLASLVCSLRISRGNLSAWLSLGSRLAGARARRTGRQSSLAWLGRRFDETNRLCT